jgi:hypothetical protein
VTLLNGKHKKSMVGGYCNRHFMKCIIFNFLCCSTNVVQYNVDGMNMDELQI